MSRNVRKRTFLHVRPTKTNQPAHARSLLRDVVVRMKKLCIFDYPKCVQWRFWSDCANDEADLNIRWAHMSENQYVFSRCGPCVFWLSFDCKGSQMFALSSDPLMGPSSFPFRKHAYSNILKILQPKKENFQIKKIWYFSYFCSKHRLWVLVRTASLRPLTSTHNVCFWAEIRKIMHIPVNPRFTI